MLLFSSKKRSFAQSWVKKGERPMVYTVKHSQKVHVYLGVCSKGVTKLCFCSGISRYKNIKANKPHPGVCQKECQQDIAPNLAADGQELFGDSLLYRGSWVYQLDGTPIHTTKDSIATIENLVPGGLLNGWPPNSPDLRWNENIWAWMEKELRRRPICKTALELEKALTEVWEDLRTNDQPMLRKLANSMRARLQKAMDLNGAHTG
jgi:transposase